MPLLEDGDAQSKVRQGVTTEVLGEDTSAGPAKGKLAVRERREPVRAGTPSWTTLGGYFDALESPRDRRQRRQLRRARDPAGLRPGRLARPARPRAARGDEGAPRRGDARRRASGSRRCSPAPASWPSRPTTWSSSAEVVQRHGGLYSSHIRNEGTEVFAAVKEAIDVGRARRSPGRHHPPQDRRPVALAPHGRDRRPDRRRRGARA